MIKIIQLLLTPFLFPLSWWHWLWGHIFYLILERMTGNGDGFWFHVVFDSYQTQMAISGQMQDFVNGKGRLWPWEDTIATPTQEHDK